jgi:hypothetical protein
LQVRGLFEFLAPELGAIVEAKSKTSDTAGALRRGYGEDGAVGSLVVPGFEFVSEHPPCLDATKLLRLIEACVQQIQDLVVSFLAEPVHEREERVVTASGDIRSIREWP